MTARADRQVPRATYRVQLHAGFTLADAAAIVPYLAELGVSHLYTSPVLQAAPGSTHGYDVVDHGRVSKDLGGAAAFSRLAAALRSHGMGLVMDIVPNHMAISGEENRQWWDVLEHGPASPYADWFDVDLRNPILLPVLPDELDRVLASGAIRLVRRGTELVVEHDGRPFPLAPRTVDALDESVASINADPERLAAILGAQHYRLGYWRDSFRELGYRRFFDIDDLIGLRQEDPSVFGETHRLVLGWVAEGLVDGLRVDHPDGLRNPVAYFEGLRAAAPDAWIVIEKILGADETLRTDWPVDGTTGYQFANLATSLFVDPEGEAQMTAIWASMADSAGWDEVEAVSRAEVLSSLLGSDVNRLTGLLAEVSRSVTPGRDLTRDELHQALREVAARIPVYRTYVTASPACVPPEDAALIATSVAEAVAARPDLNPEVFDLLGRVLRLEAGGPLGNELAMRFQQLTPAAMAKGVEDTAFYRHHRLVALNEVGGDPGRFGISVADFHRRMEAAADDWPAAMLSLSTHDTKRSADVRARLALLSEEPAAWGEAVERMTEAARPHRSDPDLPSAADEYLFLQTVVGAWPIDSERVVAYLVKAAREAKLRTSWTSPDTAYEEDLSRFVRDAMGDPRVAQAVEATATPLIDAGRVAALGMLALELTAPGVPDIYQGSELWDLALVDPDNRRPVNYDERRRLLAEALGMDASTSWMRRAEGVPKLWLVHHALEMRRRHPQAFGRGAGYRAIAAQGHLREAVVAFSRSAPGRDVDDVVTVVPRLVRRVEREGWSDTSLPLPEGRWRNLDGSVHGGSPPLSALLSGFPVAILERVP